MKNFKIIPIIALTLLLRTVAIDTADAADNANGRNLSLQQDGASHIPFVYFPLRIIAE